MRIIDFKVFEGKNIYSLKKCIRLDLDLEGYSEIPSKEIEGFNDTLVELLPELYEHRCGIDEEMGFVKRLKEGTYLTHICEHLVIALQNKIGIDIVYGKARELSGERYYIIYQYEYKNTGMEAGNIAVDIINSLINKKTFNLDLRINRLKEKLREEQLGISTLAICTEAKKRGIPLLKLGEESMFQLGYGKYSKRIEATISSDTKAISVDIASDKLLTKELLNINCIPVAIGGKVRDSLDLLLKARSIGYPIVLKPQFGSQGKGVFANIKNEKEAIKVYEQLRGVYSDIIIEEYIEGKDYRVCIVDGEVVAISQRIPPYILGNGKSNVKSLIMHMNMDENRGEGHEKALTKVKINEELIQYIRKNGYGLESIIPEGGKLCLRENANLSTGGFAIDCTSLICRENIEICKRVASVIDLDICGIDLRCDDISRPLNEQTPGKKGAIIEVNAAPGIRMHHHPYIGQERNAAAAIVDKLFRDIPKNIPLISITGTNGKTTTTRLIGYILSLAGYKVGMTTTGGIYINNKCIYAGDTTGPRSALAVLSNKEVDAAVLETARGGLLRNGLAYDFADVAVITNITEDHIGLDEVETIEDLAKVKALVGEAVKEDGYVVINGDDNMSISILERMKSNVIIFSKNKDNKIMLDNINNGGYGVYINKNSVCVQSGNKLFTLLKVEEIGITMRGALQYNIENAMAACAALIGIGIDFETIRKGLKSFSCNEEQNPGRFNVYDINGVLAVLDYGHNIEGYRAVLEGVKNIKHNKLIGVIGVPGDRLDSNILGAGKISGSYFDSIYIKEDKDKRGRRCGEVAELLERGVLSVKPNFRNLEIVLEEEKAFDRALETAKPGDIVIIFFEKYEPLVKNIKKRLNKEKVRDEEIVYSSS